MHTVSMFPGLTAPVTHVKIGPFCGFDVILVLLFMLSCILLRENVTLESKR